jgi:hypothetical protein
MSNGWSQYMFTFVSMSQPHSDLAQLDAPDITASDHQKLSTLDNIKKFLEGRKTHLY